MTLSDAYPEFLLEDLNDFPARLRRVLGACVSGSIDFSPAQWTASPAENMTIREQVCHLRDIEVDGYHKRFAGVLAEDRPFLASIDGAALAIERRYDETPIKCAMEDFAVARAETVSLLKSLRPADFSRTAEFEEHGDVTLLSLAHLLASHDLQHLSGVQWLLAKFAGGR